MGSGPAAPLGRTVKILYEGSLAADGSVFDKRENKRSPLGFRLGLREVVPGMDKGLEGMKVQYFTPPPPLLVAQRRGTKPSRGGENSFTYLNSPTRSASLPKLSSLQLSDASG